MPPYGGPGGPVGRCMGLYADVLGTNLGVGNFFFENSGVGDGGAGGARAPHFSERGGRAPHFRAF